MKTIDKLAAKLDEALAYFYYGGTMPKKKRNPTDATMRNINALKKRVARLEKLWKNLPKAKKKRSR